MNTNEIPFTEARPTEAGAYWYKNNEGQLYLISIDLQFRKLRCYVNCEYFWLDSFIGQWSPPLIPSTVLDEAKKGIADLMVVIKDVNDICGANDIGLDLKNKIEELLK